MLNMHYAASESQIDLVATEEDDEVPFLAVEEDGKHPYAHFAHCKVYLVLSLGWVVLLTLSVPIIIGYARPALISYGLEPSQCTILVESIKAVNDENSAECHEDTFECALSRAKCAFEEIPLCYQRSCRCLEIRADVITDGVKKESRMMYDFEDTFLNFPMCSIYPCSDDYDFDDLMTRIQAGTKQIRCFANKYVTVYHPRNPPSASGIVFGALIVPLFLILAWLVLSCYVMKRTWRVTRRDLKQAIEFRFNTWPPRPAFTVHASGANSARTDVTYDY